MRRSKPGREALPSGCTAGSSSVQGRLSRLSRVQRNSTAAAALQSSTAPLPFADAGSLSNPGSLSNSGFLSKPGFPPNPGPSSSSATPSSASRAEYRSSGSPISPMIANSNN
jgi:hypothetical protein